MPISRDPIHQTLARLGVRLAELAAWRDREAPAFALRGALWLAKAGAFADATTKADPRQSKSGHQQFPSFRGSFS